jgi:hypothetical protein
MRRAAWVLPVVAMVSVAAAWGCRGERPYLADDPGTYPCRADWECPPGSVCLDGRTCGSAPGVPAPGGSSSAASGPDTSSSAWEPRAAALGSPCQGSRFTRPAYCGQVASGAVCVDDDAGALCAVPGCAPPDADCADGAGVCVVLHGAPVCLSRCVPDADAGTGCGEGARCAAVAGQEVCLPAGRDW